MEIMAGTVMIIGPGFMGINHLNNLLELERQGKVKVVSVVDTNEKQLEKITAQVFKTTNIQEAFFKTKPDIVSICTNTQTHFSVLSEILDLSERTGKKVAIFMEKPLVASSDEATPIIARLKKMGYGTKLAFTCGYLFPYSPIVKKGIAALKASDLKIKKISTIWIKDRPPTRPTEGVHIDEATHPIDAIINKILRGLGYTFSAVQIVKAEHKRETEDHPICDRGKQDELYKGNENKRIPVVDVRYELKAAGIPIIGHSSFIQGPQKREIAVECEGGTTVVFKFDENKKDILEIRSQDNVKVFEETPNKLLLEWETFLEYVKTGEKSFEIPSFEDMYFDLRLTEALELNGPFPMTIGRNSDA